MKYALSAILKNNMESLATWLSFLYGNQSWVADALPSRAGAHSGQDESLPLSSQKGHSWVLCTTMDNVHSLASFTK